MRAAKFVEHIRDSSSKVVEDKLAHKSLSQREFVIIMEIGYEQIDSASAFVEYVFEEYGFPKSTVWYNLKKLKKRGILSFAEKGEAQRPLELTEYGIALMRNIASTTAVNSAYEIVLTQS